MKRFMSEKVERKKNFSWLYLNRNFSVRRLRQRSWISKHSQIRGKTPTKSDTKLLHDRERAKPKEEKPRKNAIRIAKEVRILVKNCIMGEKEEYSSFRPNEQLGKKGVVGKRYTYNTNRSKDSRMQKVSEKWEKNWRHNAGAKPSDTRRKTE